MYPQTEYLLAYALVFAFLILGMLIVCIPRPRKKGFVDPDALKKQNRISAGKKAKAKTQKIADKAKKKRAKAVAKKKKQNQKLGA